MNQIKVNTYTIQVRKKNNRKPEKKDGKTQTLKYEQFGKLTDKLGKAHDFVSTFKSFIKEFDNSFLGLKSENKAMRLSNEIKFNSKEETIFGFFKAGFTGEQKEIFEKSTSSDESIFVVKSEHVNCSDFYFKLWIPSKSNVGLLLIQGTSTESAGDLFKTLLHIFLTKEFTDNTIKISRFTSNDMVDEFKKKSKVERIVLTKNSYPKDVANSILGQDILESDVRLKLVIEGDFKNDVVLKFINDNIGTSLGNQAKFFTSDTLEDLHFGESDEYDTNISFRDRINSKAAIAKSRSGYEILPFTYIEESEIVRNEKTGVATKDSIKNAIEKYFLKVQKEIS